MEYINLRLAGRALVKLFIAALPWLSWIALLGGYLWGSEHVIYWVWHQLVVYLDPETAGTGFILSTLANIFLMIAWLVMYANLNDEKGC